MSEFLTAARQEGSLSHEGAHVVSQALELYRSTVNREIQGLDHLLDAVRTAPGVEAFALSEPMLERAIQLSIDGPDRLKPFDEAILAAVLVRARELRESHPGHPDFDLAFCTLDGDLQPWTRARSRREPLASLYEQAGLQVHGDFATLARAP
jgi:hypothetical protein